MAEAITIKKLPGALRFTLGGASVITEVTVPDTTGTISFNPSAAIILAFDGEVDAQVLVSTNYVTIPASQWTHFKWASLDKRNSARDTFFLAGVAGGEVVEILAQD